MKSYHEPYIKLKGIVLPYFMASTLACSFFDTLIRHFEVNQEKIKA